MSLLHREENYSQGLPLKSLNAPLMLLPSQVKGRKYYVRHGEWQLGFPRQRLEATRFVIILDLFAEVRG